MWHHTFGPNVNLERICGGQKLELDVRTGPQILTDSPTVSGVSSFKTEQSSSSKQRQNSVMCDLITDDHQDDYGAVWTLTLIF